jgi:hypothetical protein
MAEGDHAEEEEPMEEEAHAESDGEAHADLEEKMSSKEKMKKGLYKEEDHSEEDLEEEMKDEEEVDLEEIIKALREEEDEEKSMDEEKEEDELEEAYNVIKFLRSKLNEVNLLNAKLLYVNKLFKKGELTETKKVKIIETFDRVKTVREAKLVYATLAESMTARPARKAAPKRKAKNLTEGIASSRSKGTKKVIADSNGVYNRFTELINYNK